MGEQLVRVEVPTGVQFVLKLPHGEELIVHQSQHHRHMTLKLTCRPSRHIGFNWMPPSFSQRGVPETVLLEVIDEQERR